MKKLLLALFMLIVSTSCFVSQAPMGEEVEPVQIQVLIIPTSPGCTLSKVRIYDDLGNTYQAQGCNDGVVELAEGRSLGWVELFGVETLGWSVYQIH